MKSLEITFKAKIQQYEYAGRDGEFAPAFVQVPKNLASHANRDAFRQSKAFGAYANSDLFESLLHRAIAKMGIGKTIRTANPPQGVSIDDSGFLSIITITIPDAR